MEAFAESSAFIEAAQIPGDIAGGLVPGPENPDGHYTYLLVRLADLEVVRQENDERYQDLLGGDSITEINQNLQDHPSAKVAAIAAALVRRRRLDSEITTLHQEKLILEQHLSLNPLSLAPEIEAKPVESPVTETSMPEPESIAPPVTKPYAVPRDKTRLNGSRPKTEDRPTRYRFIWEIGFEDNVAEVLDMLVNMGILHKDKTPAAVPVSNRPLLEKLFAKELIDQAELESGNLSLTSLTRAMVYGAGTGGRFLRNDETKSRALQIIDEKVTQRLAMKRPRRSDNYMSKARERDL